jgi:prepilin-type N-terminal cleavage/methylation domain-containing protein
MHQRKGFTLIELLVVIAIIAILAAILFPVFAQAREKARQSACLSNTKQIATALQIYTSDYDERTPGGCFAKFSCAGVPGGYIDEMGRPTTAPNNFTGLWPLRPYLKSDKVFICPSGDWLSRPNARPVQGSYASNRAAVEDSRSLAEFESPSDFVAYADAVVPWIDDLGGGYVPHRIADVLQQLGREPVSQLQPPRHGPAQPGHQSGVCGRPRQVEQAGADSLQPVVGEPPADGQEIQLPHHGVL